MSEATISEPIQNNQNEQDDAAHGYRVIKRIPTREEIEQRAYNLFLERGAGDGRDQQDWFQAKGELVRLWWE